MINVLVLEILPYDLLRDLVGLNETEFCCPRPGLSSAGEIFSRRAASELGTGYSTLKRMSELG